MTQDQFKRLRIGDKIRCVWDEAPRLVYNRIYTVMWHERTKCLYIPYDDSPDNGHAIQHCLQYWELISIPRKRFKDSNIP